MLERLELSKRVLGLSVWKIAWRDRDGWKNKWNIGIDSFIFEVGAFPIPTVFGLRQAWWLDPFVSVSQRGRGDALARVRAQWGHES